MHKPLSDERQNLISKSNRALRTLPAIKKTAFLVSCLLLVALSSSIFYVHARTEYIKPFPYDLLIFTVANKAFQESGELYQRNDDMSEAYKPGARLYKFPPAYQLAITPWVSPDIPTAVFFNISRIATLLMYVISMAWLAVLLAKTFSLQNHWPLWLTIVWVHASLSQGFVGAFELQTAELPFLLLFTASMAILNRWPGVSGAAIALAASSKLYPAFMLAGGLLSKHRRAWFTGFAITAAGMCLAGLAVFGFKENAFYVSHVLPTLLNESLSAHPHNVSLGAFAVTHFYSGDAGRAQWIITALKAAVVIGSLIVVWRHHTRHADCSQQTMLVYAFLMTGMLVFMPNYWRQYWLLLSIPVLVGSAILIHRKQWLALTLWNLVAFSTHMNPHAIWMLTYLYLTGVLGSISPEELVRHASTPGMNQLLLEHSVLIWIINWFSECRMLAPLLLWVSLAYLCIKPDSKLTLPHAHATSA